MSRKPKSSGEVVGRVASALIECPLTGDEIRSLERLEARRQEADAEQLRATTQDQKARAYAKAAKCGEDAVELMQRVNARRDAKWSARALNELDALADLRGEDLVETQVGARIKLTPLTRLRNAKLISGEEAAAGALYGTTWQRLYAGATGDGTGNGELDPIDARLMDLRRLDDARGNAVDANGRQITDSGLGGDARLIQLADRICGAEESLRQVFGTSGQKRRVGMQRLRKALGMLAGHYQLYKTYASDLKAA